MNFIELKNFFINLDQIVSVDKSSDNFTLVFSTGDTLRLDAEESQKLRERLTSHENNEILENVPCASIS
jgi:hypothetical protein